MSDFVIQLRRDPAALQLIKPNNPVLKDIFYALPESERQGVDLPERGYLIKQFLEEWARVQQAKRRGETIEDTQMVEPTSEVKARSKKNISAFEESRDFQPEPAPVSSPDFSAPPSARRQFLEEDDANSKAKQRQARRSRLSARFAEDAAPSPYEASPPMSTTSSSSRRRDFLSSSRADPLLDSAYRPRVNYSMSDDEEYGGRRYYRDSSRRDRHVRADDYYGDVSPGDALLYAPSPFHRSGRSPRNMGEYRRSPHPLTTPRSHHRASLSFTMPSKSPRPSYGSHRRSRSPSPPRKSATPMSFMSASSNADCPHCASKDDTIARLQRLVSSLLDQLDGFALDARGQLTRTMDAYGGHNH